MLRVLYFRTFPTYGAILCDLTASMFLLFVSQSLSQQIEPSLGNKSSFLISLSVSSAIIVVDWRTDIAPSEILMHMQRIQAAIDHFKLSSIELAQPSTSYEAGVMMSDRLDFVAWERMRQS